MTEREGLVALVEKILECAGSEEEIDTWLDDLQMRVPHPAVTDLIYRNETALTPDEIIDAALSYRPVRLPPP